MLRYTDEWRDYVTRQARWVDFDNDYKTLDLDFMESVMWAFKALYDKGLIYQGFRVLPYSWYEQTPLSNQETRLDDAYKMRQDPAVTVDDAAARRAGAARRRQRPDLDHHAVDAAVEPRDRGAPRHRLRPGAGADGKRYVLAKERLGHYARELGEAPEVLAEHTGAELVGLSYEPPFDFFVGHRERAPRALRRLRHHRVRHRNRPPRTGFR